MPSDRFAAQPVHRSPVLAGLIDDAAIFPPGDLPLAEAVPAHTAHLSSGYAPVLGRFVVDAGRLAPLAELVPAGKPLAILLTGSAASLPGALESVRSSPALRLAGVELAPGDLAELRAARQLLPPGVALWSEVPFDRLDRISAAGKLGVALKFRTGGLLRTAFPSAAELAEAIARSVLAGVRFKLTAGLHRAVRQRAADGFEHHGFANVLLATEAAQRGVPQSRVEKLLALEDGTELSALWHERLTALPTARTAFRSFGSCSIAEPLDSLAAMLALAPGPRQMPDKTEELL